MRFANTVLKTGSANYTDEKQPVYGVIADARYCTKRTCLQTGRGTMLFETPQWATTILVDIAKQKKRYRKRPTLTFKHSKWGGWHGHYKGGYRNEIVIFAPNRTKATDTFTLFDGEAMLLHEIAHWLNRPQARVYFYGDKRKRKQSHGKRFYRIVFRLMKQYNIPYSAYKSEFAYKPKGALKGFSQVYKCTWIS